ncbi:MAG: SAM-dependent methyltransferase [Bacteroidetes bacterium]|nr:MAG: SAM-dependent methyltransferase [Bacteroidota bacterium]
MIDFSSLPKKYASEYDRNLAIENWVNSLPDNFVFSKAEREFAQLYSGKGQEFSKDNKLIAEGLYEFYTPDYLKRKMWELAGIYGYDGGPILEPSCSTGHFFDMAPDNAKKVGVELNPLTAKIARLSFPNAAIHNIYFEQLFLDNSRNRWNKLLKGKTTWIEEYPFSLVIGNPPYGKHYNLYSGFFKNHYQVEIFFLIKCLELLKSGGVLVFLTSSNWLRNGDMYNDLKKQVLSMATLVDAYRMPKVFKRSAVPTDILVYKKK